MNDKEIKKIIDDIVWWIPFKNLRNNIRKLLINNYIVNNKINELLNITDNLNNEVDNIKNINYANSNELKKDSKSCNSEIVNKYLLGIKGIEIGRASYANYGIDAINIDRIDIRKTNNDNEYFKEQVKFSNIITKVDLIANGDDLPFKDNTLDFVFTSHVLEHFYDPIKALQEWYRVVKIGGYVFMIIPHKERTFDKDRERTTLNELISRHNQKIKTEEQLTDKHHSVWITEDVLELCKYLNMNVVEYHDMDDYRQDGFIIVIQK